MTADPVVAILDHGSGNLRSVARAVARAGGRPLVTADPGAVAGADAVVVPGVGAFDACLRSMRAAGLDEAIVRAAAADRPVLGVCLGMQALYEGSEEGDEPGLGLLPGAVRRLAPGPGVRVPHMGWNRVRWTAPHPATAGLPSGTRFYFVHAYAADAAGAATVGVAEHGRPFAAAAARGPVLAVQFHPEKSGTAGLALYAAFVALARARRGLGAERGTA